MMKLAVLAVLMAVASATVYDNYAGARRGYGYNAGYAKKGLGYQIAGRPEDYIAGCGGNAYSTHNEACCGGVIYNRRHQDCCAGYLVINKPQQCPGLPRVYRNLGYKTGHDAGYNTGYDAGYNTGYNTGYGYDTYNKGY